MIKKRLKDQLNITAIFISEVRMQLQNHQESTLKKDCSIKEASLSSYRMET